MDLPPRKGMPSRQDVEMVASPYGTKRNVGTGSSSGIMRALRGVGLGQNKLVAWTPSLEEDALPSGRGNGRWLLWHQGQDGQGSSHFNPRPAYMSEEEPLSFDSPDGAQLAQVERNLE